MIRESLVLLALVVLSGVSAIQPGCRTRYELRMKWTVQNNYSRYWECARWGKAVQKSCPNGTLFAAPYQTCVPSKAWEEFPYYNPPTTAFDSEDQCTEEKTQCVDSCIDVPCENGIVLDNKCDCGDGTLLKGVCTDPSITCIGGRVVNGVCVCFGTATLVDGVCVASPGEIDTCGENGDWNAIENYCICHEGYQFINGWCVSAQGICEGAPEEAYVRGSLDCVAPVCTQEVYDPNYHWPTRNPQTFWQCASPGELKEMPCSIGTCFSAYEQTCVKVEDWVNECK